MSFPRLDAWFVVSRPVNSVVRWLLRLEIDNPKMLLPDTEYRRELERVAEKLKMSATLVNIRGDGAAQFVYAQNDARSLEISQSNEGVWIEFWQGENESPTHEVTVSSFDDAVHSSSEWLSF